MDVDEFHGQGGTYEVREGKRVLITPPTQPHPEGDRARRADGSPVDATPAPAGEQPQPEQLGARGAHDTYSAGHGGDGGSDN